LEGGTKDEMRIFEGSTFQWIMAQIDFDLGASIRHRNAQSISFVVIECSYLRFARRNNVRIREHFQSTFQGCGSAGNRPSKILVLASVKTTLADDRVGPKWR
jgi:hypothetical protein